MHFADIHLQVNALEDFVVIHFDVQILDFQQTHSRSSHSLRHCYFLAGALPYPTLPSRLTFSSFCASTANSMGSSRNTRLQKPFTIIETASSALSPRCRK